MGSRGAGRRAIHAVVPRGPCSFLSSPLRVLSYHFLSPGSCTPLAVGGTGDRASGGPCRGLEQPRDPPSLARASSSGWQHCPRGCSRLAARGVLGWLCKPRAENAVCPVLAWETSLWLACFSCCSFSFLCLLGRAHLPCTCPPEHACLAAWALSSCRRGQQPVFSPRRSCCLPDLPPLSCCGSQGGRGRARPEDCCPPTRLPGAGPSCTAGCPSVPASQQSQRSRSFR